MKNNVHIANHSENGIDFPIIGIGASAGGLAPFEAILAELPHPLDAAIVLVLHQPADRKSILPEILRSKFPSRDIVEAADGMSVENGKVYLNPFDGDLSIQDRLFKVNVLSKNGLRLPIDFFFASLAENVQEKAAAVILSGTGNDGVRGVREVQCKGGVVLAQDPAGAEFSSMPAAAIDTGNVDETLPPAELGRHLAKLIATFHDVPTSDEPSSISQLETLLSILHEKADFRFKEYKRKVVARRVQRRMALYGLSNIQEYVDLINKKPLEIGQLASDMMIGVTAFFRDKYAWEGLRENVVRKLVAEKKPEEPIRVWAPACSTGEESYSVAMMFLREIELAGKRNDLQVFASDINEVSLAKARDGKYADSVSTDVPPEYIKAYFSCLEDGLSLQINKYVRDHIVFAKQNVLADPPFSKLDLVICRNLLIYLEQGAQEKCVSIFHYALKEEGFLFLGNAESIGQQKRLFASLGDKNRRIYKRLAHGQPERYPFPTTTATSPAREPGVPPSAVSGERNITTFAHELLLSLYAPASVLVNSRYQILYITGAVQRFVKPPAGEFSADFISWISEESRNRLRGGLYSASQGSAPIALPVSLPNEEGGGRTVMLRIQKHCHPIDKSDIFLVVFEDSVAGPQTPKATKASDADTAALRQMERELASTRDELQTNIEELKSANEEMQSSNEELQAANEEMETSREELQSLNEELLTVNAQLQAKIEEQEVTNNDLNNFFSSTDIPTLFLDVKLGVKRFTPSLKRLVTLMPMDLGRPITDFSLANLGPNLVAEMEAVIESLVPHKSEIEVGAFWYSRTILPYRTSDNRIEGAVITFVDITEHKRLIEEIRMLAKFPSENPNPVLRVGKDGVILYANEPGKPLLTMWKCDIGGAVPDPLRSEISESFAIATQGNLEIECEKRCYSFVVVPIQEAGYVNLYGRDITIRKIAEEALRQSKGQNEFLANIIESSSQPFGVGYPDGRMGLVNKAFEELTGYTAKELHSVDWAQNLTPPEWNTVEQQKLEELAATGNSVRYEKEYIRKNGSRVPVELLVHLSKDANGNPLYYSFLTDITQRKLAEAALLASEQRYRTTMDAMMEGCQIIGRDWKYVYINQAAERHNRRPSSELIGNRYMQMWPGIESTHAFEVIRDCIENGTSHVLENEFIFPDGTVGWFDLRIQPVPEGVFILSTDVTERKRAEHGLRESEQRLKFHFENSPLAVVEWDVDYIVTQWSKEAETIFGWSKEEVMGKRIDTLNLIHADDIPIVNSTMERLSSGKERTVVSSNRNYTKSGAVINCTWYNSVLVDDKEQMSSVMSLVLDVTERMRNEDALRQSEERYRNLFNSLIEGFCIVEMVFNDAGKPVDYRFLEVNETFEQQTGLHDAQGKLMRELAPGHEEHWFEIYGNIALTGKPARFVNQAQALNRWFDVHAFRIGGDESRKVAICFSDITQRNQAEGALRQSEKKYRRIVETANEGIILADTDGTMNYVNKKFSDMLGYPPEKLLGKAGLEFMPDEEKEHVLANREKLETKNQVQGEYCFIRNDGNRIWTFGNTVPILDDAGKHIANLAMHTDITGRKRAEEEIQRNVEELRLKNEELTQFNNVMVDREIRMIELKKEINQLCGRLGQHPVYDVDFDKPEGNDALSENSL